MWNHWMLSVCPALVSWFFWCHCAFDGGFVPTYLRSQKCEKKSGETETASRCHSIYWQCNPRMRCDFWCNIFYLTFQYWWNINSMLFWLVNVCVEQSELCVDSSLFITNIFRSIGKRIWSIFFDLDTCCWILFSNACTVLPYHRIYRLCIHTTHICMHAIEREKNRNMKTTIWWHWFICYKRILLLYYVQNFILKQKLSFFLHSSGKWQPNKLINHAKECKKNSHHTITLGKW